MLNIISALDEKSTLKDVNSPHQAYAWFLHDAFEKLGYPSRLVSQGESRIPPADNTLITSRGAMLKMSDKSSPGYRNMVRGATRRKVALYLNSDFSMGYSYDITFTIVPPPHTPWGGKYVFTGAGADPSHCYPGDQGERALFLDRLCHSANPHRYAEQSRIYQAYLRVLPTTGVKIYDHNKRASYFMTPKIFEPVNIPWSEMQKIFRKCHYYCCTQWGESGLTRIEAATCGALLLVPKPLYFPRTFSILPHVIWRNEAELKKALAMKTDPEVISRRVKEKHTWDFAARRIMRVLG